MINPNEALGGGQCIEVSAEQFCNSGHTDYGAVGLVEALKVSSDTYFFRSASTPTVHGNVIQKKAYELGIGRPTGIDLPSEITARSPAGSGWRDRTGEEYQCERQHHGHPCGIVAEPGEPWTVGDNMDLAVGQGSLQTVPLQMAVAYSTLTNAYLHGGNGTVVTPHLGMEIDEADGGLVQSLNFPPQRHVHLNYADLSLVMEGIHEAASQPGGTSADVWTGWDQEQHPVYGKTGTAERAGRSNRRGTCAMWATPSGRS